MSRDLVLAITAITGTTALVFGFIEVGAFLLLAALVVVLATAPTRDQRDARRRNRH